MALERQVADADVSFAIPFTPTGVFFQDDFENYTSVITEDNWTNIGSKVSLQTSGGVSSSQHLRVAYDSQSTGPYTVSKNVLSQNLSEVYVKFNFRQDGQLHGSKFLKIFGEQNNPEGNANVTFIMNYNNNNLSRVGYGDGAGITNDSQAFINYDGTVDSDNPAVIVVSTGEYNIPISQWDEFQAYWKYNTNGNLDGEVKIWINGLLKLHATGLKNRHNLNSRNMWKIELGGYSDGRVTPYTPFNLDYDNVVMSTAFIPHGS